MITKSLSLYQEPLPSSVNKIINSGVLDYFKGLLHFENAPLISDTSYSYHIKKFASQIASIFFLNKASQNYAILYRKQAVPMTMLNRHKKKKDTFAVRTVETVHYETIEEGFFLLRVGFFSIRNTQDIIMLCKLAFDDENYSNYGGLILNTDLSYKELVAVIKKGFFEVDAKTNEIAPSYKKGNDLCDFKNIYQFCGGGDFGRFFLLQLSK